MKYILLSLNSTTNINNAIIDAIKQAFLIKPEEVRFDNVTCLDTEINNNSYSNREIVLNERLLELCSRLSSIYGVDVSLNSMELTDSKVNANILINGKLITVSQ